MKGLIFTYLLTYGGTATSLFKPYIGLLIYVCFSIIRPESLWYWSVPEGNYSRIVAMGLVLGWGINGFGSWRFGRAKPVVFFLLAFWVWCIVSSLMASVPGVSLAWVEQFSKAVLPCIVGITLIDSVAKLKQLAWVIVLSHGYVAYDLNQAYYSGFNRVQEIGFGGMDNNCVAITMVACTGVALFLGFSAPRWWQKGLAFASVSLMVHTVLFCFTRGGMLGLIITTLAAFFLIPKTGKHYLMFALLVLLGLRLAGPQVVERFFTTFADQQARDTSAQSRVEMWNTCISIMTGSPFVGIGPRHFPLVSHLFGYTPFKEAHTLWLQVGAETGAVGLFFLLAFYGTCVLRLWPLTRPSTPVSDPFFRDTARMVIASTLGFGIAAQFVSLVGLEAPYYIAMLGAGALKLSSVPATASVPAPASRYVPAWS